MFMASSSCPTDEEEKDLGLSEATFGRVESRTSCDHLGSLSPDLTKIPPPHSPCNSCYYPTENWLCLSCKQVLCSRYVNKHMLHHFEDTNHSVILSFNDLSFWCFSCQAFLDALQIPQLLPLHQLVYALKFGESTDASLDARDSPKICKCGALSKMQLSWSKNNPGRRFYGCGNYNKSKCDYLNWFDPPTSLFHASLFNNFMEEIKKLKLEVEAHKASAREKFGALDNDVSTALYAEGLRYLQKEIKSLKVESEVQKKKLEVLERRVG